MESSNLWEPEIPCNGNLWFPGWEPWVSSSGKRQFLAFGPHTGKYQFQLLEPKIICNGNLWFPGWEPGVLYPGKPAVACNGNLWFPCWQPWVLTFGNQKFFAMVSYGSQVGNQEFQALGTGSSLWWGPVVPTFATVSSKLWKPEVLYNGNLWFPGWELSAKHKHSGTGPFRKAKRSIPDH